MFGGTGIAHGTGRDHGEFPTAIQDLLPRYLDDVPFDPMDATGAAMRYRREQDGSAIVWSIGRNETDESGDIESSSQSGGDFGFRINGRGKR
jgi:hypothetical protein